MSDNSKKLKEKYQEKNRYSNFGACIRKMHVNGFRGIKDLELSLDFPIIAISGLNGAGKSTLGQLAICAYKKPSTSVDYKRHYIKDFFPVSPADPKPISDDAKSIYIYETDDYRKPQEITTSRANSAWSGYKRQPERHCYYIGFTVYIPKVERRDLSVYGGASLEFTEKREIDSGVISKMATIIGHKYEDINFQGISHKGKEGEVGIAKRLGHSYSENNMGFGEGRILYTVDRLETAPEQSLFILEEPETSLHENAQYEFAKYLLEVCNRRHHQIILSTHSSVILDALPAEARKLLVRNEDGVLIHDGISSHQIRSLLSGGKKRDIDICVEDEFAKILLTEILRTKNKDLLKAIAITAIGDKRAVQQAVSILRKTGKKAVAVRDADVGEAAKDGLFSFPGTLPPEKEVYGNSEVQKTLKEKFDVDVDWVVKDETDHHQYTKLLAAAAQTEESVLRNLAIIAYIEKSGQDFSKVTSNIQNYINT